MNPLSTSDDLHSWFNTATAVVEFAVTCLAVRHSRKTRSHLRKVERETSEVTDERIRDCVNDVLMANPDLIRNLAADVLLERRLRERLEERDE